MGYIQNNNFNYGKLFLSCKKWLKKVDGLCTKITF